MSDVVAWMHGDCLNGGWLPEGVPAVFVFDEARLRQDGWTLKRIGFVYECLLELPVTILRGDPVPLLADFAAEQGASRVVTVETPDAHLRCQMEQLRALLPVSVLPERRMVDLPGSVDLRRFSRYWQKAMPRLLR